MKKNCLFQNFVFLLKIALVDIITIKNIRNLNNYISEIHLVVKGSGKQRFLDRDFNTNPSEVIVNGISKGNSCKKLSDLEQDINNVILKFDKKINSCNLMFYNLENIIEIDLSYFDASEVTNMRSMFYDCKNLEKINFGNINTSSVENMFALFYNCQQLTSIDLSNFDTSKVNNMQWMFGNCINLKFLDLSNFVNLNICDMQSMFNKCRSLIYLNLISFHLSDRISMNDAFKDISSYVKICANDEKIKTILSQKGIYNDCSDICFKSNIKIDVVNNKCIDSCYENRYKYKFNNICYNECPEGSFPLSDKELDNNNFENFKNCYDKAPKGY